MNNGSNGKMDDEEDPNLLETNANGSESMRGSSHEKHSLRLYSSLHSTAKDSAVDLEEDSSSSEVEQTPLPASRPTQRSGSLELEGINEVGERSKDEYDNSSKPDMNIDEPRPRPRPRPRVSFQNNNTNGAVSRRSMWQSRSRSRSSKHLVSQKSRLLDSNEVMHLMGFDDESYK